MRLLRQLSVLLLASVLLYAVGCASGEGRGAAQVEVIVDGPRTTVRTDAGGTGSSRDDDEDDEESKKK